MFKILSEPGYMTSLSGCSCDYIAMLAYKDLATKYKNLEISEYFDFLWKQTRQSNLKLKYRIYTVKSDTPLRCFLEIMLLHVIVNKDKSVFLPILRDNKENHIGSLNASHIYYTPVKDFSYDMLVTSFITERFKGAEKKNDYFHHNIKIYVKAFLKYVMEVEADYVNSIKTN